jgi:hypothetical protein
MNRTTWDSDKEYELPEKAHFIQVLNQILVYEVLVF